MFRFLSFAAAAGAFALAVLGSWVRINGAGLTCPDWPLCHGALVPSLHGGVVLEWTHRLIAMLLIVPLAGAIVAAWREREQIAGIVPTVLWIAAAFAIQVILGGATVRLANSPLSVALHWGTGMLLLAGLVALATLSVLRPAVRRGARVPSPLLPLLIASAVAAFAAMCVGSYVSSSGAGLACPSLPLCVHGVPLGNDPSQMAQMIHRILAAALVVFAVASAWASFALAGGRLRAAALAGCGLVALQVVLGIANVVLALPMGFREAHAANAAATFVVYVVAGLLAAVDVPSGRLATERSRAVPVWVRAFGEQGPA